MERKSSLSIYALAGAVLIAGLVNATIAESATTKSDKTKIYNLEQSLITLQSQYACFVRCANGNFSTLNMMKASDRIKIYLNDDCR